MNNTMDDSIQYDDLIFSKKLVVNKMSQKGVCII
jgi:hypothetical protein